MNGCLNRSKARFWKDAAGRQSGTTIRMCAYLDGLDVEADTRNSDGESQLHSEYSKYFAHKAVSNLKLSKSGCCLILRHAERQMTAILSVVGCVKGLRLIAHEWLRACTWVSWWGGLLSIVTVKPISCANKTRSLHHAYSHCGEAPRQPAANPSKARGKLVDACHSEAQKNIENLYAKFNEKSDDVPPSPETTPPPPPFLLLPSSSRVENVVRPWNRGSCPPAAARQDTQRQQRQVHRSAVSQPRYVTQLLAALYLDSRAGSSWR